MTTLRRSTLLFALLIVTLSTANAQPRSITNQLVVHLTFDNTLSDDSGRGNNATYNSANGLVTNPAAPTFVAGKIGQAFQFTTATDGSRIDFATLGYPSDLKFGATNDFAISFWVYNTNNAGDPGLISNKNWYSAGNRGWGIFAQPATNFRVQMADDSGLKFSVKPAGVIRDGAWHHIAVSYQRGASGVVKTYFDGALIDSTGYTATGNIDSDDLVNGLGAPYAVNIGEDGTGGYNNSVANPPPVTSSGGSGIYNAAIDDVGIWRRTLTDVEVASIFNFGLKGTNLFNIPDVHSPVILAASPVNGASGVAPNVPTTFTILDQDTKLNTNSVRLLIDGTPASVVLTKSGATNSVNYSLPYLFAPSTKHTNTLIFADNGAPTTVTNVAVYTIGSWTNLYLPAPLYFENFDELPTPTNPPTTYPSGWTTSNCTDFGGVSVWDLFHEKSDAYYDWQIVPIGIIAANFNYGSRVLNVNSPLVVNGSVITTLGSNNIAFAASDQRGGSQIDMLFTGDYNLSGKSNIWVAFNSIYSQEDNQIASLEYSIDSGSTWQPVVYMISTAAASLASTNNVVDPYALMTISNSKIPFCQASNDGNYFGAFIGVSSNLWPTLGPYLSLRAGSDHVTFHRVERYRLPLADGQSAVRLRFMLAGANSWDWGIDSLGLYSIPIPPPLHLTAVAQSRTNLTISWNGTGPYAASGLQKTTSLTTPSWVNLPGTIGQTSFTDSVSGGTVYYRVVAF